MARPGKHLKQLNNRALRRINRAVTSYERGDRDMPPIEPPIPIGDDGGEPVRLGTISATWNKGATATVTEINGDGTAISGNPTFTAKNWFATVTVTTGTKKVACAPVGDTWILIAAECG